MAVLITCSGLALNPKKANYLSVDNSRTTKSQIISFLTLLQGGRGVKNSRSWTNKEFK
jgi:hypothetical protein